MLGKIKVSSVQSCLDWVILVLLKIEVRLGIIKYRSNEVSKF